MVALQHLVPSQNMVAEDDGLRRLQVRQPRHDGMGLPLRQVRQERHVLPQERADGFHLVPQKQAQVRGDLVVARPARVDFLARRADALNQRGLDVQMHIFQLLAPLKPPGLDLLQDALQARHDLVALRRRQRAHPGQHGGVGDRPANVIRRQPLIEGNGLGETLHEPVGGLGEAAAPGFVFFGFHVQRLLVSFPRGFSVAAWSRGHSSRLSGRGARVYSLTRFVQASAFMS